MSWWPADVTDIGQNALRPLPHHPVNSADTAGPKAGIRTHSLVCKFL